MPDILATLYGATPISKRAWVICRVMTSWPQPTQSVDFRPPYSLTVRPMRFDGGALGSATEDISSSPRLRSPRPRSRRRGGSRRSGGSNAASRRRPSAPRGAGCRASGRRGSGRRRRRGRARRRRRRPPRSAGAPAAAGSRSAAPCAASRWRASWTAKSEEPYAMTPTRAPARVHDGLRHEAPRRLELAAEAVHVAPVVVGPLGVGRALGVARAAREVGGRRVVDDAGQRPVRDAVAVHVLVAGELLELPDVLAELLLRANAPCRGRSASRGRRTGRTSSCSCRGRGRVITKTGVWNRSARSKASIVSS